MVNVVFGANDLDLSLEGLTVSEAQFSCQNILNVSMEADAYLDGHLVVDKDFGRLDEGPTAGVHAPQWQEKRREGVAR